MDKGAWRATVHRVSKSRTKLSDLSKQNKQCREGFCGRVCGPLGSSPPPGPSQSFGAEAGVIEFCHPFPFPCTWRCKGNTVGALGRLETGWWDRVVSDTNFILRALPYDPGMLRS